jgi:hypothetical protein
MNFQTNEYPNLQVGLPVDVNLECDTFIIESCLSPALTIKTFHNSSFLAFAGRVYRSDALGGGISSIEANTPNDTVVITFGKGLILNQAGSSGLVIPNPLPISWNEEDDYIPGNVFDVGNASVSFPVRNYATARVGWFTKGNLPMNITDQFGQPMALIEQDGGTTLISPVAVASFKLGTVSAYYFNLQGCGQINFQTAGTNWQLRIGLSQRPFTLL